MGQILCALLDPRKIFYLSPGLFSSPSWFTSLGREMRLTLVGKVVSKKDRPGAFGGTAGIQTVFLLFLLHKLFA
jgi:hypothetical protein